MNDKVREKWELVSDKWHEISPFKQKVIVTLLVSLVLVLGLTVYLATRVQYGVLFTDLSEGDAGKIVTDLKSQKVAYKLADNGTTILVPTNQVDETRIDLAVANELPDSTTGFELFDNANMMTTDSDRKIMYQRALTGELERSIDSLDEVETARVILVLPKDSVFEDEKQSASASIVLKLKGGSLPQSTVQGIVALTSGAVQGLKADNVKVVDSNGNLLSGNSSSDSTAATTGSQMSAERTYEKSLQAKIISLLSPLYGTNKVQATVNVALDYDSVTQKKTTYAKPKVRSENVQATGSANDIQQAQTGQANSNVSNVTGDNSTNDKTYSRTINNELNTTTTKTISAPGRVQRVTVSVLINGNLFTGDRKQVRQLIENAVGYSKKRGDRVTVEGLRFAKTKATKITATKAKTPSFFGRYWPYLLVALLAIIGVAITIFLLLRRRRDGDDVEAEQEPVTPTLPPAANHAVEPMTEPKPEESVPEPVAPPSPSQKKAEKARNYAGKNPDVAAELIKAWIKDEHHE